MKKHIIFVALLFATALSHGQIKVVENTPSVRIGRIGSIVTTFFYLDKTGDVYTVQYQDSSIPKEEVFRSFSFRDQDNAFENLYRMIMHGFDNPPQEDVKLELPDDFVLLHFSKVFGKIQMQFISTPKSVASLSGSSVYLNKRQAAKLFGKQPAKR
jgi:hypothetical protein